MLPNMLIKNYVVESYITDFREYKTQITGENFQVCVMSGIIKTKERDEETDRRRTNRE